MMTDSQERHRLAVAVRIGRAQISSLLTALPHVCPADNCSGAGAADLELTDLHLFSEFSR
jgi:hypothetical protein